MQTSQIFLKVEFIHNVMAARLNQHFFITVFVNSCIYCVLTNSTLLYKQIQYFIDFISFHSWAASAVRWFRIVLLKLSASVNVWPLRVFMLKWVWAVRFMAVVSGSHVGVCLQHLSQTRSLDPQTTAFLPPLHQGRVTSCRGDLELDSVPFCIWYRVMSFGTCHILSLKPVERPEGQT